MRPRLVALGFLFFFIAIAIAFPHVIYDQFIWKYFWGPIVADANGVYSVEYDGITAISGYNVVNTLTYAVLTIVALYIAYGKLKERSSKKDVERFILALFPLIIYGSVARVLEDLGLFLSLQLQALFISPLIYIQTLILFLCIIFASKRAENSRLPYPLITGILVCDAAIVLLKSHLAIEMSPFYLIAVSALFILLSVRFREWHMQGLIFSLFLLSLALYYIFYFSAHSDVMVLLASLSLPALITALSFVLPAPGYFKSPYSLMAIFSQSLDATATYIGLSYFGYYEKHVLPSLFMDFAGPWVMIPIKLAVVFLIIYAIKDEDETIKKIILLLVIILGLAPGIRDALRITLGV
ncbi:MAG: DUF63 family protein [Candidatus Thermoplasmatota archaeon]|nr:DUF63 family protein [Candidatus Thermoplasmatota archaeon]